ncbi:MAG TPA: TonB-dependent receptor, partial [bacterium]|nr:TonB-dependent receptor [bacterium]
KKTVLILLLASSPLFAQEQSPTPPSSATPSASPDSSTMMEMDVYAARLDISHKELSPVQIQRARDTGDLSGELENQSGLEVEGEGMGKAWSTVSFRGQSFHDTVFLVNGVRMPESFNLSTIPTDDIENVETVEGVAALAYGSDALGGVLNITTRKAENRVWGLQMSAGDFNTYQFQGSTASFDLAGVKNALSGSWFTTDGYLPPIVDSKGVTYGFTDQVHWDVSHTASWKMGEGEASLSSSYFRHTGSAPDEDNVIAAGTDQYDLDGRQDAWGIQSALRNNQPLGGGWVFNDSLNGDYSSVLRSNPIGADPTSGVYHPYLNQYLDYGVKAAFSGPAGALLPGLSFGLEAENESLWSGLYGDHRRWRETLSASGTLKLADNVRLEVANNLDNFTDYGLAENPSASFVLDAAKGWLIRLGAGKGFKIPTYDQLYLPFTNFAALPPDLQAQFSASPFASVWAGDKGNPALSPEQSWEGELETDLKLGAWQVDLSGFLDEYQNLINPAVDASDNFWTYVNIPHALFAGTEDSLEWNPDGLFNPKVSVTWLSATDDAGNPIQGRLRFKFTAGADLNPEKAWNFGADARYVEDNPVAVQYLTDLGKPIPPSAYWDLGAHLQYTVSDHLRGFLKVENLLNTQMASLQGIPLPGRYLEGGFQGIF